ncbi:hypothetical protein [Burkholderia sp. BCC1644]|uniref:hypothetical protein n=1 Tax=Burkholderia sp. BCC1644 TaxID=2676293 RepID=UPI0015913B26|nr:hypothetical protein [Burkholderia sp. BCC1644]
MSEQAVPSTQSLLSQINAKRAPLPSMLIDRTPPAVLGSFGAGSPAGENRRVVLRP